MSFSTSRMTRRRRKRTFVERWRKVQEALLLLLHDSSRHDHLVLLSSLVSPLSSHTLQIICPLFLPWHRRSCDNFALPPTEHLHLTFSFFVLHAPLLDQRMSSPLRSFSLVIIHTCNSHQQKTRFIPNLIRISSLQRCI